MNVFLALFGLMLMIVAVILVAAIVISPLLVYRYRRNKRAEREREAAMLATLHSL